MSKRKKIAAAEAEINDETGALEKRTEPTVATESPDQIREHLKSAKESLSTSFMKVSEYLYIVRRDELFKGWGFKKFRDYVENEAGFEIRKAEQLCEIYEMYNVKLAAHRPDAPHVIEEIGWTKAHRLLPALADDGSNLDEWLAQAKEASVRELEKAVKGPKAPKDDDGDGERMVKRKFILTPDQNDNLDAALNAVASGSGGEEPGKLLDLLSTFYLATDPDDFVGRVVARLEENTGFRIVVIDQDGSVKYGQEHVETIT